MKGCRYWIAVAAISAVLSARAEIPLSTLGQLELQFGDVTTATEYTHADYVAVPTPLPGSAMRMIAPIAPQQRLYLVANGEPVEQGQKIALLRGAEVHHFFDNYAALTESYQLAKKRYDANQALYKTGSVSQEKWQQITADYLKARLEWGHFNHFSEIFSAVPDDEDAGYLLAPIAGYFFFASDEGSPDAVNLGEVVADENIRLRTLLPASLATSVTRLGLSQCSLPIERREHIAAQMMVAVWSATMTNACAGLPGQFIRVTPITEQKVQMISPNALFTHHQQTQVLVKDGQRLVPMPVNVIAQTNTQQLVIAYTPELLGKSVLTTSVSAVQGLLIGLGEQP
jgi:hypothetical protein